MGVWRRTTKDIRCGGCGTVVKRGDPIQLLTRFLKVRCKACATEDPPDLPEAPPPKSQPFSPLPFQPLRGLALDWKQRQAEREPGEDG